LIYHSATGFKLGDLSQLRRENLFSATSGKKKKKKKKKKIKRYNLVPWWNYRRGTISRPSGINFLNFRAGIFKQ